VRVMIIGAVLSLAACSAAVPSVTPLPTLSATLEPGLLGVATAATARDLLPQQLLAPWELQKSDPEPGPWQFDAWARDLQIAGAFEAAVAGAVHDGQNGAAIYVLAAPKQRLDPQISNGPAFARRWVVAYACDPPRIVTLAGVAVTTVHAQASCRSHYLLVFRDQLVVIEDAPDMTQVALDPHAFDPLIRAILKQAEQAPPPTPSSGLLRPIG